MTQRPNILLIIADGMQARVLDPSHPCKTPNLDRLSSRGVRITDAYTPLPTCSPARASLMTGLLPHNHGVLQVEHVADPDQCNLRDERPHFAQHLQKAGYQTAYIGKWHIERTEELDRYGWQQFEALGKEAHQSFSRGHDSGGEGVDDGEVGYLDGQEGYRPIVHWAVTDVPVSERQVSQPATRALPYLDGLMKGDDPWCCCVSYYEPNEALVVGREAFELYDVDSLALPETLADPLEDRPGLYRRQQRIYDHLDEAHWRHALACYYGRISELDAQVGRLLDRLEASGELDNTIIVFTADHGKYVGGHGLEAHNVGGFEEIYNVPMLIAGPGVSGGGAVEARVGLQDVGPTLLEMAGAEPIDVPDSRSFAALLSDPSGWAGDFTRGYAEYFGTRFLLTQRIAWDGPWKFVFNGFDEDELYHLHDDPNEARNLAADPEHAGRVRSMMTQIWSRMHETDDRTLLDTHYYSMRIAAVGPDVGRGGA